MNYIFVYTFDLKLHLGKQMMDRGMDLMMVLLKKEPEIKKYLIFSEHDPVSQIITSGKMMFLAHRFVL